MKTLILRWIVNAIAIGIAVALVPGVQVGRLPGPDIPALLGVALIFGLVNAVVRPVLSALSCSLIILSLGLFTFIINTAMLYLTAYLARGVDIPFYIEGFVSAFIAAFLITVISLILGMLIPDRDERRERRRR